MIHTTADAAAALIGARCIGVEFIYRQRPVEARARAVFDGALRSRLRALASTPDAALLLLCASEPAADSLAPLLDGLPFPVVRAQVNPDPLDAAPDPGTPTACHWDAPANWEPIATTDRWARIAFALAVGHALAERGSAGALVFAAHDAVWGPGLLATLHEASASFQVNGVAAAVSPYTPFQHSPMPGVTIPAEAIAAINAAFGRDPSLSERMVRGTMQGFWGKTGLLPYTLCGPVLAGANRRVWEDDLEIDRAIRAAGFATRALWIDDPAHYRQSLPVFDAQAVRTVIDRTLHYSLHVAARPIGANSLLTAPLPPALIARRAADPDYAAALDLTERLTADCLSAAAERVARFGASWIDWGAYRHVVRIGDPFVTVWKLTHSP